MKLLHLDSAITGEASVSRRLSRAIVDRLVALSPGTTVTYRDLAADPLPPVTATDLAAFATPAEPGEVVGEFIAADTVVIGAPMYNFGVPSQRKSWVDDISVPGVTFERTPQGPRGLVSGNRVVIASARGGFYCPESPAHANEHQESYLRAVMSSLDVAEIAMIRAEGVAAGPERAAAAIDAALAEIDRLELAVAA